MAQISFHNVTRSLSGGKVVVKNLNLEIEPGEFFVLAGPANSGKATVLRMIAGTEPITDGDLVIGDERVEPGKLNKRNVGMIFQNFMLYPGMTVRENLEFGMKLQGEPKEKIKSCVAATAALYKIETILGCYPRELNELQKQYVAMARAHVHEPIAYLILDSLQRLTPTERAKARKRLKEVHEEVGRTLVYVTDSGSEVTKLGKRTAIMRRGMIEQIGMVEELQEHPRNLFVAQFMFEPCFCTELVKIHRTQSTVEAIHENFGIDVPAAWIPVLEKNDLIGKKILMGYTVDEVPGEDEEKEWIAPSADSRIFFFDPATGKTYE